MQIAKGKPTDGYIARINRFFSVRISLLISPFEITPNAVTLFSFSISIIGSILFLIPTYPALIIGGILVQLSSILDGCDGEISRLRMSMSAYGGWLDTTLDRYSDTIVLLALGYRILSVNPDLFVYAIVTLAIAGSILTSYSKKEFRIIFGYEFDYAEKILHFFDYLRRDARLFIIFLGCLFNIPLPTIIVVALLTNIQTILRLFYEYPKRIFLK
ncbi:MAG: CDP-alcohol phosphatidyltransferase family protein [bacterium]|nr:CDP-alcohol phosphatidyltransferase family protein [bacterium]